MPERICPKSVLSDQLIIEAMVGKYCASLPLYRQQAIIKRDAGVQIALSTLNDGVLRVGELLIPIAAAMKREVLAGTYIQADETPIGVQTHDKRGRNHQAYMWQYGSPGKGVVFDFRMGREGEGPKQFLWQFQMGCCRPTATQGYNHVGGPMMVHACCLAHARRKYVDAVKINAKDQESARVVAMMDELFAIDREAREQNLDHAQRDMLRQERAPELLDKLREAVLALKKTALPKSAAGQAANYTLSFWSKLTVFLKYPELELSTNLAENAMRSIAIGRKNWLHLGSKEAGPKIAAIFSVVESCRRLNIPIRRYLATSFPDLLTAPSNPSPSLPPPLRRQNGELTSQLTAQAVNRVVAWMDTVEQQKGRSIERPFSCCSFSFRWSLEVELACDLRLARSAACGDIAEDAAAIGASWIVELCVVEDVVAFHTDLEADVVVGAQCKVFWPERGW